MGYGTGAPQGAVAPSENWSVYDQSAANLDNAAWMATTAGNTMANPMQVAYNPATQAAQAAMPGYAQNVTSGSYSTQNVPLQGSVSNVNAQGYNPATAQMYGTQTSTVGGTGYGARNMETPMLTQADMNQYMNPYDQAVTDRTLQGLETQRQMQMNDIGASATAANAFGGSRHGVTEALTNEAFANTAADTLATQNQASFAQAQQAAQFDTSNQFAANQTNQAAQNTAAQYNAGNVQQANLANQAAEQARQQMGTQVNLANADATNQAGQYNSGLSMQAQQSNQQSQLAQQNLATNTGLANQAAADAASQFNLSASQQAQLANQQAQLEAMGLQTNTSQFNASQANQNNQFNAGNDLQAQLANQQNQINAANVGLGAANSLNTIGGTQYGIGADIANTQWQQGLYQQAMQQQLYDLAAQQFAGYTGSPAQSLSPILAALGVGASTGAGTTTESYTPGLFDYLSLGASF
jgi:hypothetical protein